jgi:hypothetical protein
MPETASRNGAAPTAAAADDETDEEALDGAA